MGENHKEYSPAKEFIKEENETDSDDETSETVEKTLLESSSSKDKDAEASDDAISVNSGNENNDSHDADLAREDSALECVDNPLTSNYHDDCLSSSQVPVIIMASPFEIPLDPEIDPDESKSSSTTNQQPAVKKSLMTSTNPASSDISILESPANPIESNITIVTQDPEEASPRACGESTTLFNMDTNKIEIVVDQGQNEIVLLCEDPKSDKHRLPVLENRRTSDEDKNLSYSLIKVNDSKSKEESGTSTGGLVRMLLGAQNANSEDVEEGGHCEKSDKVVLNGHTLVRGPQVQLTSRKPDPASSDEVVKKT